MNDQSSDEQQALVNDYLKSVTTFDISPSYITDKEKLKSEIYLLLTPGWLRFRSVEEPVKKFMQEMIAQFVDQNVPIRVLNAMGGFKNHRIDTAPHIDYGELFHMNFFIKALARICAIYEPGVELEYSGDAHMASIVDNIKREHVDTYIQEFNDLLELFGTYIPANMRLSYKHFLDFYDFDDMKAKVDQATDNADFSEARNQELISAYYPRAKSNFCVNGEIDYSGLSPEELETKIKKSVLQAYTWYDLDFGVRGDYFMSFIGVCNLSEFPESPESYCVRSVRYLPCPPFWQGKGVIQINGQTVVPTILHVNKYVEIGEDLPAIAIEKPLLDIPSLYELQVFQST